MKATIEAITTFEGKFTFEATSSVLSKIALALLIALLTARKTSSNAIPIIKKIIDQIVTKIIKATSKPDMFLAYSLWHRTPKINLKRGNEVSTNKKYGAADCANY